MSMPLEEKYMTLHTHTAVVVVLVVHTAFASVGVPQAVQELEALLHPVVVEHRG